MNVSLSLQVKEGVYEGFLNPHLHDYFFKASNLVPVPQNLKILVSNREHHDEHNPSDHWSTQKENQDIIHIFLPPSKFLGPIWNLDFACIASRNLSVTDLSVHLLDY